MIKSILKFFMPIAIKRKIAIILSEYSRKFNGKYTHGFIIETKDFSYAVAADDISVGWTLRRTGVYGEQELASIKKLVNHESKVVFLGTHIGALAIPTSKIVKSSVLIEANPRTYKFLQMNLILNKIANATSHNVAIGEHVGEIEFVSNVVNSGGSKRKPAIDKKMYYYDNPKIIKVPMTTLDILCNDNDQNIDLVFMDIEGSEYFALKGMTNVLQRTEALMMEFIPHHLDFVAGCTVGNLIEPLAEIFQFCYVPSKNIYLKSNQYKEFFEEMHYRNESDDGLIFTKKYVSFSEKLKS